ncbi:hypothetical protein IMG5_056050, partial [Ichthyophthirius multifiliis]
FQKETNYQDIVDRSDDKYKLESLIQEKMEQNSQLFSLDYIKQRLNEKLQQNQETKQKVSQNNTKPPSTFAQIMISHNKQTTTDREQNQKQKKNQQFIQEQFNILSESDNFVEDKNIQQQDYFYTRKRSTSHNQKKTEQEYIQSQQYPFKPQINDLPQQIYGESENINISKQEQWERLLKDKINAITERDNQKIIYQKQEIEQNCTFKPQINEISKHIMADKPSDMPIQERLYKEAEKIQQQKEELKRKHENSQIYTFKPDIQQSISNLKGELAFTKPLYQRLQQVMQEKQENLLELQIKNQNDNQYTFKPELNQKTYQIAKEKLQGKNVVQRLLIDAIDKENRKSKIIEESQLSINKLCTFQPQINPSNRSDYQEDENQSKRQQEFVQRQYLMADYLKEKLEEKIKQIDKDSEYKFKPQINPISNYLINADEERARETTDDKIKRLYEQEGKVHLILQLLIKTIQRNQKKRKELEYEEMKECTFNPITKEFENGDYKEKLNEVKGVDRFLLQKELQKNKEEQKKKREDEVFTLKSYSQYRQQNKTIFQPFKLSKGNGPNKNKLREEIMKECLEQCTFQPQTNEAKNREAIQRILDRMEKQNQFINEDDNGIE